VALSNTMAANSQYFGQVTDMYYNANVTNTFISVGTNGFAATSPDGNVWTLANTKTNADFYSMAFGNGRVLAVGTTGTAKISPNGVLWSGHASNVNVFSIAYYANSVNSFVMVGASRAQNTLFGQMNVNVAWSGGVSNTAYTYVLETSNDGIYWTTQQWKTATYPGFAAGGNVSAIIMEAPVLGANTPGHLVATSTPNRNTSGRTSVSNNLTTWSGLGMTSAYGNTDLHLEKIVPATINISFANGSFYATGNTGIVARSNDGIYWTTSNVLDQFSNTAQYQSAIPAATAFGGMYKLVYHPASSTYVLPHAHGVLISKDAVTWNVRPNMYPNANTHTNQFNVDGPLMLYIANTSAIQYTNNWYNFISASYDTTSEFYVPGIAWRGGTAWYTYYNGQVGQAYLQTPGTWDFGGPYVAQSQTFGMTPELLFYVKAKN
jgi:hypothetical protein